MIYSVLIFVQRFSEFANAHPIILQHHEVSVVSASFWASYTNPLFLLMNPLQTLILLCTSKNCTLEQDEILLI